MIAERWLELAYDGCFNHTLQRIYFYIARTDFTSVTVPAAHEPVTRSTTPTTLTVV